MLVESWKAAGADSGPGRKGRLWDPVVRSQEAKSNPESFAAMICMGLPQRGHKEGSSSQIFSSGEKSISGAGWKPLRENNPSRRAFYFGEGRKKAL